MTSITCHSTLNETRDDLPAGYPPFMFGKLHDIVQALEHFFVFKEFGMHDFDEFTKFGNKEHHEFKRRPHVDKKKKAAS